MTTGRRLWAIPLIWLLTVAGASTLTWTVISSAGAQVGQPSAVVVTPGSAGSARLGQATQTWTGRGGRLTATCTNGSISLDTASPDVGYWVKVHDQGPQSLRVDFESTDPDDRSEVRIESVCTDGSPVFRKL